MADALGYRTGDSAVLPARASIIGESPVMQRVRAFVARAATVPSTVLLLGATGTGKELVARAIHDASPRGRGPLVVVNCAGLTESLLESEFFGHRRGTFTGAVADKRGLFHAADGGTLFLDEIGDASRALQAQLLRVLEGGEIRPVGATEAIKIDVRVIAASNRDLARLVDAGKFREDLYYRLRVLELRLPALAERREDIPSLARHLLTELSGRLGRPPAHLAPAALSTLLRHEFRGNVRELRNLIERALLLAGPEEPITERHLLEAEAGARLDAAAGVSTPSNGAPRSLHEEQRLFARALIASALERNRGNKSRTARELGVSYRWLLQLMARCHLR
jgi:transcriptional regulator with PAS, ATPase and Fis domain